MNVCFVRVVLVDAVEDVLLALLGAETESLLQPVAYSTT